MATVNLLTSSFNGKLGAHYGVEQYNKKFVKAVPFSHTPHNATQTRCVRAFEVLNRVSAKIGEQFFPYLPLSCKTMSKMNAVAHFLKPTVQNHRFDPTKLSEVFGDTPTFELVEKRRYPEYGYYLIGVENLIPPTNYTDSMYYVGIFSPSGYQKGWKVAQAESALWQITYDQMNEESDIIIILRTVRRGNKIIPFFAISEGNPLPLIDNGIMYCERFDYPEDFSLQGTVLSCTDRNFTSIENGVATIYY